MAGFHLFYMHLVLGVDAINFELISGRWESPFWRIYDFIMLFFAWLHGANGVRIVLDDYVHHPSWRVLVKAILYVIVFVILILGSYVVFTFQPA